MKTSTIVAVLSAAAGAMAAPAGAKQFTPRANATVTPAASAAHPAGFIFPTLIKNHDINTNLNSLDDKTNTVRKGGVEKSTLYEIPVPSYAAGKTCSLVVFSGSPIDVVSGEKALDIFNNLIPDLNAQTSGNLRNNPLARVRFDAASGLFDFDSADVVPRIESFPCPAGKTLEWESVAVGTTDTVLLKQDWYFTAGQVPNGLTIAYW